MPSRSHPGLCNAQKTNPRFLVVVMSVVKCSVEKGFCRAHKKKKIDAYHM